eukprot:5099392-Lingulodinium_polyedra.AAC.1
MMKLVRELDVALVNTFWGETGNLHTCSYPDRAAKQIDYVGISRGLMDHAKGSVLDSVATISDHRAICVKIFGKP